MTRNNIKNRTAYLKPSEPYQNLMQTKPFLINHQEPLNLTKVTEGNPLTLSSQNVDDLYHCMSTLIKEKLRAFSHKSCSSTVGAQDKHIKQKIKNTRGQKLLLYTNRKKNAAVNSKRWHYIPQVIRIMK